MAHIEMCLAAAEISRSHVDFLACPVKAAAALLIVLGAAALDAAAATALTHRQQRSLRTARRTRVNGAARLAG